MAHHLGEKKVTTEVKDRTSPTFKDPTEAGFAKFTNSWLKEMLERFSTESETEESQNDTIEDDIGYNLADIQ